MFLFRGVLCFFFFFYATFWGFVGFLGPPSGFLRAPWGVFRGASAP